MGNESGMKNQILPSPPSMKSESGSQKYQTVYQMYTATSPNRYFFSFSPLNLLIFFSIQKNIYQNQSIKIIIFQIWGGEGGCISFIRTGLNPIPMRGSDVLNVKEPYADPTLPFFNWNRTIQEIGNLLCIRFGSFHAMLFIYCHEFMCLCIFLFMYIVHTYIMYIYVYCIIINPCRIFYQSLLQGSKQAKSDKLVITNNILLTLHGLLIIKHINF